MDMLFTVISEIVTDEDSAKRVASDWWDIFVGLKALERPGKRTDPSAVARWTKFGKLMEPTLLAEVVRREAPFELSGSKERSHCGWYRCPLHEPGEAVGRWDMMRCTRCQEVCCHAVFTVRLRLTLDMTN